MKYWLYRIKKEDYMKLVDKNNIAIDFLPQEVAADDLFIVHVSDGGVVAGAYKKEKDNLVAEKLAAKEIKLSDFYKKLSIVSFVNERTYKLFAKKVKEITKEDYEAILCAL